MSVWYLKRNDELLLDLDDAYRKTSSGRNWLEEFFRRRLKSAVLSGKLKVKKVCIAESLSRNHLHIAVLLAEPIPELEGLVWQLVLGSDLYRGRADLMRYASGIKPASLLIRSGRFPRFWRPPDAQCKCQNKHDTVKMGELGDRACKVWRRYRGASPWQLFGEPLREEKTVKLNLGIVALNRILS
jgi:hypothetical protein